MYAAAVEIPLTVEHNVPREEQHAWELQGMELIARGRVACVLIATSLAPATDDATAKQPHVAVADLDLPSGKCLLQLYAERLLKVQQLAAINTFGDNSPVTQQIHW